MTVVPRRFAALLVVALALIGTVVLARPADAATDVYAQQFNICGKKCNVDKGFSLRPVDMVDYLEAVQNPKPVFITLNEVCHSQYAELVNGRDFNQLAGGRGYAYYFVTTRTQNLPTGCGNAYGNVVFVKGTPQGGPLTKDYVNQDPADLTVPVERRKMICETVNVFMILAACSTHTDPDGDFPTLQSTEAYNFVQSNYTGKRRFAGGDFNTTSAPNWPSTYWDVDLLLGMRPTHSAETGKSLSRKIDYIWGAQAYLSGVPSGNPACNMWPTSDHCHLSGKFTVT